MDYDELKRRFDFHPATTDERRKQHERVRVAAWDLADDWDDRLPDGREKSIAIIKLEEAMFWANAAVARQ